MYKYFNMIQTYKYCRFVSDEKIPLSSLVSMFLPRLLEIKGKIFPYVKVT